MVSDARLTSEFWVSAYRKLLELHNIPIFLRERGDNTAGAVLVKLNTLDGNAILYQRGFAFDGPRGWEVLAEGEDLIVEEAISRQSSFDPDLWVLEIEDAQGRTFLEEDGIRD